MEGQKMSPKGQKLLVLLYGPHNVRFTLGLPGTHTQSLNHCLHGGSSLKSFI